MYMNDNNQEVSSADILEFLQEHMVVKDDLKDFSTKEDLKELKLELKEDIRKLDEKFDKRFDSIESRLVEFQTELEDIKIQLAAVEKKLHEDTNALNSLLFSEVGGIKKRVAFLEQKLGLQGMDFNGASI